MYLLSSLVLLGLLLPPAMQVAGSGTMTGQERDVSGVAAVINGLRPGLSVRFVIAPFVSPQIKLGAYQIEAVVGSSVVVETSRYFLPEIELSPGTVYTVSLQGSAVEVSANE